MLSRQKVSRRTCTRRKCTRQTCTRQNVTETERWPYLVGVQGGEEKPGKEREWRSWRRVDGGSGQILGSHAGSSEETGPGFGFCWDDGRSSTPRMTEDNDLNVFNNCLINNSVKNNVHDLYKLDSEVRDKVRTEVLDSINTGMKLQNDFNSEVSDSLRPNGNKNKGFKEWEKNIVMHLKNVNISERENHKTSYVKFKLF